MKACLHTRGFFAEHVGGVTGSGGLALFGTSVGGLVACLRGWQAGNHRLTLAFQVFGFGAKLDVRAENLPRFKPVTQAQALPQISRC